jgi:3-oxoacyl-[acyl-carrier protein] reductase
MTAEQWDETMRVNQTSAWTVCQQAARLMVPKGRGAIVTIASTAGQRGEAEHAHYAASKGAILAITRSLGAELGPRGIRVNCVAPGFVPTPGSAHYGDYDPTRTPLGRVARVSDLLGTFCYLLSDDSAFVSGQTMLVNGGRVPY